MLALAAAPEKPQAAEMIKTKPGSSDAVSSPQVCRNYPGFSGPLDELCEMNKNKINEAWLTSKQTNGVTVSLIASAKQYLSQALCTCPGLTKHKASNQS